MARTDMEQLSRVLHRALSNMSQSMTDRYIEKNAQFRYDAGLSPHIIRTSSGHCCEWCNQVAGRYSYPDVPKDVYRRHDNCDCTVEYVVGKKSIDVHTHKRVDEFEQKKIIEERKKIGIEEKEKSDKIKERDLQKYIGKPIQYVDNQSVREWYYANVHDIPNQIDRTKPFEEQVRQAFELRNKYKHEARIAMSDKETANMLEEKKPAPTFEKLLEDKMKRKGMTKDQALIDILLTASKTNSGVDNDFGL